RSARAFSRGLAAGDVGLQQSRVRDRVRDTVRDESDQVAHIFSGEAIFAANAGREGRKDPRSGAPGASSDASRLASSYVPCGYSLCSPVSPVVMILIVNSCAAKPLPPVARCDVYNPPFITSVRKLASQGAL